MLINFISREYFYSIYKKIEENALSYKCFSTSFAVYIIVSFFIVIGNIKEEFSFFIAFMRAFTGIIAFMLIVIDYWQYDYKKVFPWFWFFSLFYCLPFINILALLSSDFHSSWVANVAVAISLLAMLTPWIGVLIIGSSGAILAVTVYSFIMNGNNKLSDITYYVSHEIIITYILVLIVTILIYNQEKVHKNIIIKNMEKKLGITSNIIKEALAIRSEILNNFSHEMRVPLQGVSTFSSFLPVWDNLSQNEREDLIKTANENLKIFLGFIENILTFVGNKNYIMENCFDIDKHDLSEILNNIYYKYKQLCIYLRNQEGKELNIILNVQKDVDYNILCNYKQIVNLIENILDNSLKYSDKGDIEITLTESKIKNVNNEFVNAIKVSIKDSGIGIPKDELNKIFDPFVRSSLTKTSAHGRGLGLSACLKIVKTYGGKISIHNNPSPQKGITTELILPVNYIFSQNVNFEQSNLIGLLIVYSKKSMAILYQININDLKLILISNTEINNTNILTFIKNYATQIDIAYIIDDKDYTAFEYLKDNIANSKDTEHIQLIKKI